MAKKSRESGTGLTGLIMECLVGRGLGVLVELTSDGAEVHAVAQNGPEGVFYSVKGETVYKALDKLYKKVNKELWNDEPPF